MQYAPLWFYDFMMLSYLFWSWTVSNVTKVPKQSNESGIILAGSTRRAAVPSKEVHARAAKLGISASRAIYTFSVSLLVMYFSSVFRGKDVPWHRSSHGGIDAVITVADFLNNFRGACRAVKKKESSLVPLIPSSDTRMIHERGDNVQFSGSTDRGEGKIRDSQFIVVDGSRQFTIQQCRMS